MPNPTYSLDLPLEIAELIIDESYLAGDKDSLRNIALASRRFTARCQQLLLRTIDLGDRCIPGGLYYDRLRHFLHLNPDLGRAVHELRLVDTYVWDREKAVNWGWLVVEEGLSEVLSCMPELRAFSLRFNAAQPQWPSFVPQLRHDIIQLIQRPKVQSVALAHITQFPPSLLVTLMASVRRLDINDVVVQEFSAAAPLEVVLGVAAIATPVVESITLRTPKAPFLLTMHNILSTAPVPTLKSLRIEAVDHTDELAMLQLWNLLYWARDTITDLVWLPSVRPLMAATLPPPPIDLSVLPRLASLHFLVNFHAPTPVFAALLPLLAQIASGPRFTRLVVECMFMKPVELVACQRDWVALDTVLAAEPFDGLKEVVFVARRRAAPAERAGAALIIDEILPLSRARGVRVRFDRNLDLH